MYIGLRLQLSRHIGKAAWSTADKILYLLIGVVYFIPQKVIGESNWGLFALAQVLLTTIYMLSDGFALQVMVNFGVREENRRQAMTVSAVFHVLFILLCTTGVFFGREIIASIYNKPDLASVLTLFPVVSLGFLLRNYFLKVSQLHIDTRGAFIIDAAWIGTTVALLIYGWQSGTLVTAEDMMVISAISSGVSSLTGLALFGRTVQLTMQFDRTLLRRMIRFGVTQFGSAATIAIQSQGDVLILGRFVSEATVGNYDVAKKIFRGFEGLRDAGSLFVYPSVAKLHAQGRMREMTLLVEKMMGFMLIVIVPAVLFIWVGPVDYFFQLIYKDGYQQAPDIFRILSLAAIAIPFSMNIYVLNGLSEVRKLFRVTLISVILFFATAVILVPQIGVEGQAIAVAVSYFSLGIFSTIAVHSMVPFTLYGVFGRWRDALDFLRKTWRQVMQRKS